MLEKSNDEPLPKYQEHAVFIERSDGTIKFKDVKFLILPLDNAKKKNIVTNIAFWSQKFKGVEHS